MPKAVVVATKTRPCIVLYKATGNPRERFDSPIGMAGFCIASFLKLQSGNKILDSIINSIIPIWHELSSNYINVKEHSKIGMLIACNNLSLHALDADSDLALLAAIRFTLLMCISMQNFLA